MKFVTELDIDSGETACIDTYAFTEKPIGRIPITGGGGAAAIFVPVFGALLKDGSQVGAEEFSPSRRDR